MRRAIATVCLSGMLRDKLQAIAQARFDGVEIFENDLLQFSGKPREVRAICAHLGLAIDMFQPFRDFDGASEAHVQRSLDRAARKFDVMDELGTDLMLVCSSVQPDASGDPALLADQFRRLAELAGARGKRVSYEALAWGSKVNRYAQVWDVVRRVDHPALGMTLDSFHTLAIRDDPAPIAQLPGEKIFYVQLADAPWIQTTDVLSFSRHWRCFPGQGEFDVVGFVGALLAAGYRGTLSLEIFNDEFRSAPARASALDAMRSLLWLEEQVRRDPAADQADAATSHGPFASRERAAESSPVALLAPPPAPPLRNWAFVEFAVDPGNAPRLHAFLDRLGFAHAADHRSKDVRLYALGDVRLVLNLEQDSFARSFCDVHGTSVCAVALATPDPRGAMARAVALGCVPVQGHVGPGELAIPAITAPDGSLLYFCEQVQGQPRPAFEEDFAALGPLAPLPGAATARIDHLVQAVPPGQIQPWVLFERAVLGLPVARNTVYHDPYGVLRSREIESPDQRVRLSIVVSERDNTVMSRSVARYGGAGVQQIAIAVDDLLALLKALRARGAPMLPVPENYYDDLGARHADLDDAFIARLREAGAMYERDAHGDFLHAYSETFDDRFEFEFVQRRGGYALYGSTNAPMHLAALAEWRGRRDGGEAGSPEAV